MRDKVYWRCTQYTTPHKCHARIHTIHQHVIHKTQHNHIGQYKSRGKTIF